MNSLFRKILMEHYWVIVSVSFGGICILLWYKWDKKCLSQEDLALTVTLIGSVISVFFVVQKQANEDIRLFSELFTDFNKRYDRLNEKLNRLVKKAELTDDEKGTFMDYFNLCGEEYLYYKRGHILPDVWKAWCNGILFFFDKNEKVKKLWLEEEKSASYYGLTLKIIEKDAGKKNKVRHSKK